MRSSSQGKVLRAGVLSVLMVVSSGAAVWLAPPELPDTGQRHSLEAEIPQAFGDWKVDKSIVPVAMSADVENALYEVYDAVVGRTYVNSRGDRMMLSVGYTRQQGGKQKPHWQEICYRAQGFAVESLTRGPAHVAGRDIPVTRMVATQRSRVEPVTYWLTLGDQVVANRWDRMARLLAMGLRQQTTDGYLVRISNVTDQTGAAFDSHVRFADDLAGALPADRARKLFGRL
jgi:EpsI family protein